MRSRLMLAALAALALATACAAPGESGAPRAAVAEEDAHALTVEEVRAAYDRAVTAWGWFELSPLPCGEETAEVDGRLYRRVDYAGMDELKDLRAYLRGLFSPELTERLLAGDGYAPYVDVDGALYTAAAGRSRELGRDVPQVEISRVDDTAYDVTVTVDLLGPDGRTVTGMECYAFPYELVEGRWVFTAFQMVY